MHFLAVLLIAQSTTGPLPAIDFDLKQPPVTRVCTAGGADIVVCGKVRKPVETLPDIEIAGPPRAEISLFGDVKAGAGLEGANVGGFTSNRAMVRVKIPL